MKQYPVGGPRQPVYDLMRGLDFSMSKWSDKYWNSLDGIDVRIFGAGSMASVSLESAPDNRVECELDKLSEYVSELRSRLPV